jgi:hypothetical protein
MEEKDVYYKQWSRRKVEGQDKLCITTASSVLRIMEAFTELVDLY